MIYTKFISRIYLCLLFVFIGKPCLCGMEEGSRPPQPNVAQTAVTTVPLHSYTEEDLKLIELTFLKTIDMIFDLKNCFGKSIRVINSSEFPHAVHDVFGVFYGFSNKDSLPEIWVPLITPNYYLERIKNWFNCPPPCYVVALMYIDRLIKRKPFDEKCFNQFTFYRLYLVALVVATKIYGNDSTLSNKDYAFIGGVNQQALADLEKQFFRIMGFGDIKDLTLSVSKEDFDAFVISLQAGGNPKI